MIEIILYQPEIPQNTGNIGRICSFSGCKLHLIHPLAKIDDRNLRRAGMDYWKDLEIFEYAEWNEFWYHRNRPKRILLLTTQAEKNIWEMEFRIGDGLLFGNEGHGAPEFVHQSVDERIKIPKFKPNLRSLNLAVATGIATYEALRQINS